MKYQEIKDAYGEFCATLGAKHSLRDTLLLGLIRQESSGNPNAVSYCGAVGLTQVMGGALSDYNKANNTSYIIDDLKDPWTSIEVGSWYLARMVKMFNGDEYKALQAYNQGAGRVKKRPDAGRWYADGVLKHEAKFVELG